jgi:hypothetical protein
MGVVNAWFFKRATDTEIDQPMYYFRMVEPDFTPLPVYHALDEFAHSDEARMLYPGVHQEDHWALTYNGPWEMRSDPDAELGSYRFAPDSSQATVTFTFEGTDLWLQSGPHDRGAILFSLDGGREEKVGIDPGNRIQLARALPRGPHTVSVVAASGPFGLDSLTIQRRPPLAPWLIAGGILVVIIVVALLVASATASRRRWYERGRAG